MGDSAALSVASIAIGQVVASYSYFLPRLTEVRRETDEDTRQDVYLGQIAAGGVSMLVGGTLSYLTSSKLPLIVSALIAAFLAAIYQFAMTQGNVRTA